MSFDDNRQLVWEEKYRPSTFFQEGQLPIILPDTPEFHGLIEMAKGERPLQHLMFYSDDSGTGKTTSIKALANDLELEHFYLNVSECGNIDTFRSVIMGYCETRSRNKKLKLVQLDEADGASMAFQKAMRSLMESAIENVRFVLTCNYPDSLINAIHSRCEKYDMSYRNNKDDMVVKITKRCLGILKKEGVENDPLAVRQLVEKNFPDMRVTIKALQRIAESHGKVDSIGVEHFGDEIGEMTQAILGLSPKKASEWYRSRGINPMRLYRPLYNTLPAMLHESLRVEAMYIIEEYLDRAGKSYDREITFYTLIVRLCDLAKQSKNLVRKG